MTAGIDGIDGTARNRVEEARRERDAALAAAQEQLSVATRLADIEYSGTIAKLRERFDMDVAEADRRHRRTVLPAHRAFNRATIAAEEHYAQVTRSEHDTLLAT